MKKTLFLILFLILTASVLVSVDFPVEVDDYYKDPFVLVNSRYVCIWDRALRVIRVYHADDMKKIADMDRKGQGPGEWQFFSTITLKEDSLYISSFPKLIHLSVDGQLIKETRCSTNSGSMIPLGKNFVGTSYPNEHRLIPGTQILFSLYNPKLEKKKKMMLTELRNVAGYKGMKKVIRAFCGTVKSRVYKDLFFVGTTEKGFYFAVFDVNGNLEYEINHEYKKRPITNSDQKRYLAEWKKGKHWNRLKNEVEYIFAEYYPPYDNFMVADGMIYVFTPEFNGERDLVILDLKGKLLATKIFPVLKEEGIIFWGRFSIHNRKFYYLEEDVDKEVWRLRTINLGKLKNRKK